MEHKHVFRSINKILWHKGLKDVAFLVHVYTYNACEVVEWSQYLLAHIALEVFDF